MVDHLLNGLLVLLICGVVGAMVSFFEPSPLLAAPVGRGPASLPCNWVEKSGRWECMNVTPAAIDEVLRVLRQTARVPLKIRIEPPFAEVVWQ